MLLVDSVLLLSPFVQTSLLAEEKVIPQASKNVCGKTDRGKGGRGSKGSERPSDSRGRGREEKGGGCSGARDGPSSSQLC